MTEVIFYEIIEDELLKFAVIISMETNLLECCSLPISEALKLSYIVKLRKS